MQGKKRQLTSEELQWVSDTMLMASQDHKPSIRWFAHQLKVSRPQLIKALGGWKGIARGRPQAPPKIQAAPAIEPIDNVIETFTSDVDKELSGAT